MSEEDTTGRTAIMGIRITIPCRYQYEGLVEALKSLGFSGCTSEDRGSGGVGMAFSSPGSSIVFSISYPGSDGDPSGIRIALELAAPPGEDPQRLLEAVGAPRCRGTEGLGWEVKPVCGWDAFLLAMRAAEHSWSRDPA